ncbi:MAG: AAA family ATPase [Firmicutes bacterium]|nr:AAA family ATPase [Bacillota bacterium]
MAKFEGFRVRNFRALKDITMGKLWNTKNNEPLTPMVAVIGKNGSGKSSIFDAFGFLSDCLKSGVEEACDSRGRGGYRRIVTNRSQEPISFEIYYRESKKDLPITYELSIAEDNKGRPYVESERLRQRRKGEKAYGRPFSFLILNKGKGTVWSGENSGFDEETNESFEADKKNEIELANPRQLGIATLGSLKDHPRIIKFREFIANWYLSYFTPDAARSLPLSGPQKHLDIKGENLSNVVQYMEREHPKRFQNILDKIAAKIPGIQKISTVKSEDGRLLLKFNEQGFKDPFYSQQMSDGTLKIFTYMLLMEDPEPPPFICIEEPENGLYHKLLEPLANEFRNHATKSGASSQIFITTHQPYFIDALDPKEVWLLTKGTDGCSVITHASKNEIVRNLNEQGLPLGGLWYSDYLD